MSKRKPFIRLHSGLQLMAESYFIEELGILGVTKRGFRALCRSLRVPLVQIGSTWFVEINSFLVAMKAVTRLGGSDVLFPGSEQVLKGRGKTVELDPAYVEKNLNMILAELYAPAYGVKTRSAIEAAKSEAKKVAEVLTAARWQVRGIWQQDQMSLEAQRRLNLARFMGNPDPTAARKEWSEEDGEEEGRD